KGFASCRQRVQGLHGDCTRWHASHTKDLPHRERRVQEALTIHCRRPTVFGHKARVAKPDSGVGQKRVQEYARRKRRRCKSTETHSREKERPCNGVCWGLRG